MRSSPSLLPVRQQIALPRIQSPCFAAAPAADPAAGRLRLRNSGYSRRNRRYRTGEYQAQPGIFIKEGRRRQALGRQCCPHSADAGAPGPSPQSWHPTGYSG